MKKIIIALLFLAGTLGFTNAGAQQKATAKKPATSTAKAKDSALEKKTGMKKDGTPDMRFKANQTAKTAHIGPLKKDSTPDMRYKANKAKVK